MANISNNDIAQAIFLFSKDKVESDQKIVSDKIINFLSRRRLLSKSTDILSRLDKIINIENEKIVVKVLSSKKIEEKNKDELIVYLKERYKAKEIILEESLDHKLLGGMRIEVNDEIIDLTVKNKIKKLQEHLIKKI
ncbi:MAG: F0F1 ATP synthase subunit delta [Candidatus Paceibacterota bacterium]|jgi:F-type H+-transporting ATPase subunit delta